MGAHANEPKVCMARACINLPPSNKINHQVDQRILVLLTPTGTLPKNFIERSRFHHLKRKISCCFRTKRFRCVDCGCLLTIPISQIRIDVVTSLSFFYPV